jgi:putative chitinase
MTPTVEHLAAAGVKEPAKWIDAITKTCAEFGIDTKERVAAFIAQCAHESGGFSTLEENLNYSAETMAAVWPNRFAIKGADGKYEKDEKGKNKPNNFALALHRKPELIANVVYASRMGNGPTESGEGFAFRGRGLKQLTGKDNVSRCGRALGVDLVSNPDLLLTPEFAARSAGWFWKANNLSQFADAGDIEGMTKRINGGLIGITDRKKRYQAVLAVQT